MIDKIQIQNIFVSQVTPLIPEADYCEPNK